MGVPGIERDRLLQQPLSEPLFLCAHGAPRLRERLQDQSGTPGFWFNVRRACAASAMTICDFTKSTTRG